MTGLVDEIVVVSWQAHVKCFHKRTGFEFGGNEHVAEQADTLPCDHRLDGMQLRCFLMTCSPGAGARSL